MGYYALSLFSTMNNKLPPRKSIPHFGENKNPNAMYLHLGENPFPPTDNVLFAIQKAAVVSNRYPDTNAVRLRKSLADYAGYGITPDNVIVGNGSDELIDLAVLSLSEPHQSVITFEPAFFVYGFCAARHSRQHLKIQQTKDFQLPPVQDIQPQISNDTGLTFIANPNNPTGILFPRDVLLDYVNHLPGIVVVDECYFEFSGETIVDVVNGYNNLIVLRSLSKSFGLSGLRLGYAVAHVDLIDRMSRHALTFPVNCIAQAAGIAALEDRDIYFDRIKLLKEEREILRESFKTFGFNVTASHTNFLLVLDGEKRKVDGLQSILTEHELLVSDQSENVGQPALRIAIGTPDENKKLVEIVKKNLPLQPNTFHP